MKFTPGVQDESSDQLRDRYVGDELEDGERVAIGTDKDRVARVSRD